MVERNYSGGRTNIISESCIDNSFTFNSGSRDCEIFGTKSCGIGGFFEKKESDVRNFIEEANKIADKLWEHGIKFAYHNHQHEFIKVNDTTTIMDMLVEGLNPEKTSFILDTCWIQYGGGDVRHWIEKLKGRINILHLKDLSRRDDDKNPIVLEEIGSGSLYWDGIIATAEKTGIDHFCVEQDGDWADGNPFNSLKMSADFLSKYLAK